METKRKAVEEFMSSVRRQMDLTPEEEQFLHEQAHNVYNKTLKTMPIVTIPQRDKVAKKATKIRDKELREIGVYKKDPFTSGDVGSVLKAIEIVAGISEYQKMQKP